MATPEDDTSTSLIANYLANLRDQRKLKLEKARKIGEEIGAEVVGACGLAIGTSAGEYLVFCERDTDNHFIVFNPDDELLEPIMEKGTYKARAINPENIFGKRMQPLDEWLE